MGSRKIYPFNTIFKTKNVKTEENVKTKQYSRGEEDV